MRCPCEGGRWPSSSLARLGWQVECPPPTTATLLLYFYFYHDNHKLPRYYYYVAGGAPTRGRSLAEALAAWQQGRPPESTAELEGLVGLMLPLLAAAGQGGSELASPENTAQERSQDLGGMDLSPGAAPTSVSSSRDSSSTAPPRGGTAMERRSLWNRDSFSGLASVRLVTLQIGDDPSVEATTAGETGHQLEAAPSARGVYPAIVATAPGAGALMTTERHGSAPASRSHLISMGTPFLEMTRRRAWAKTPDGLPPPVGPPPPPRRMQVRGSRSRQRRAPTAALTHSSS